MTFHKSLPKIVFIVTCMFLVLPLRAMAAGAGFYVSTGYGGGVYSDNDASRPNLEDFAYQKVRLGGGFVFDNALAGKSIFNYRLNLGLEGIADNMSDTSGLSYNFAGIRCNWLNDFGFALVRAQNLRWWLGPQQGLFFLTESDDNSNGIVSFDGALGLVTGLNFNMTRRFTLGVDLSARYVFELATRAKRSPNGDFDASYIGNGWEFGATISFMSRGRGRGGRW
jgi:hypothetical protein